MKHLKTYRLFESISIDDNFDKVIRVNRNDGDELLTDEVIEKLNNKNGNLDPNIIKDLFLDLIDDDILSKVEVKKMYGVNNYNKVSKNKYANYLIKIYVYFTESCNNVSELSDEKRERYLEERSKIISIIRESLDHNNLNSKLSSWNIKDCPGYAGTLARIPSRFGEQLTYRNDYDEMDLWSESLNLQTMK
jgi:hypothetical protein